ncbi:MAG: glycerol-3-phosphate acyltransferase [Deltaproteobacteria bacterium]|nr:glycerol-3-phosphate acyltransferase [Deltaproteobacteria bacterium]
MNAWAALALAFFAGSIPFGLFVAKLWGIEDVRMVGSTNIGATNVVRAAGWKAGALTFFLDFLKGLLPMLYFQCDGIACGDSNSWIGLSAVLGHCFSPFLLFRGGKGVSTSFGVLFAINVWIGLAAGLVYGLTLLTIRVSALGSLFAMLFALFEVVLFRESRAEQVAVLAIVLVVLHRHRPNWESLLKTGVIAAFAFLGFTQHSGARSPEPRTVLADFRGMPVEPGKNYSRIAALMPSIAEAIVELGAADRLAAAPQYSRIPVAYKTKIAGLGPYNRLSTEAIYAIHPDLVLASMDGNNAATVIQLEKMGLKIFLLNTQSVEQIVRSMRIIGRVIGQEKNQKLNELAEILSANSDDKSSGKTNKSVTKKPPRVFIQVGWDPVVSVSGSSFIDELVRRAGGQNIFADSPMKYPLPNTEEVLSRNPDVILICPMADDASDARKAVAFWKRFPKITAVQRDRIHVIPTDWLTKPGFTLIQGMRELRRLL